jgi:hypothetical protein
MRSFLFTPMLPFQRCRSFCEQAPGAQLPQKRWEKRTVIR